MTVDNTDGEPINLTHIQIIFYCMNIEYICIVFHSESNNSGSLLECSNVLMLGWKKCHIVPRIPSDIVGRGHSSLGNSKFYQYKLKVSITHNFLRWMGFCAPKAFHLRERWNIMWSFFGLFRGRAKKCQWGHSKSIYLPYLLFYVHKSVQITHIISWTNYSSCQVCNIRMFLYRSPEPKLQSANK